MLTLHAHGALKVRFALRQINDTAQLQGRLLRIQQFRVDDLVVFQPGHAIYSSHIDEVNNDEGIQMTFKILAISGSLRKASTNTMALRAAQKLAPPGTVIEIADISQIPLYDDDVRALGEPASVQTLKAQIRAADAVLIATPDYNFSIPGVLKNALDWVSRPPEPPFDGKPVAIMGAAPGPVGTARVQYHLRQVLVFMNTFTVNKPEVFISQSGTKFTPEGELKDEMTAKFITELLVALKTLAERVAPKRP